jgi:hypothetical protein
MRTLCSVFGDVPGAEEVRECLYNTVSWVGRVLRPPACVVVTGMIEMMIVGRTGQLV